MALITREGKGSKLSISEMDGNLLYLENLATTETISVTYEQLTSLMESQSLVPGRRYLIADYQTTDEDETTEPIVVTATTNDALSPIAYSTVNTYDILYYDVTMGRQGLITRRIDTLNDRGVEIVNDLTTGGTTEALSAEQGKVLYLSKLASSGSSYLYVSGIGNPTENAVELQASYDAAKLMLPTADNVITVAVAPGIYNFGATAFVVDTPYINIVSLTGNSDVIIRSNEIFQYSSNYGIKINANNVTIKGINCIDGTFFITNNLNMLKCEDCVGQDYSFGWSITVSGTFNRCIGGGQSFGTSGTASGTFNNCIATSGFAQTGVASGVFNYCVAKGRNSFGGSRTASGTFNYCEGGQDAFAGNGGTASGTFNYCVATTRSFGHENIASGTFNNCRAGHLSFGGIAASGTFINCTGGDSCFGGVAFQATGIASGTFMNCVAGVNSFGSASTTSIASTARLYNCRLTSGTFSTPVAGGRLIHCIDGNDAVVNYPPLEAPLDLNGTNYVIVHGKGTPEENAAELQAAYDAAKLMLPTADNVITVVVALGSYDFGATAFVVDTPYINIVSLTGNPDVIISSTEVNSEYGYTYGIKVITGYILIKGIDCKTNTFHIESHLYNLICEHCKGGYNSFGSYGTTVPGTFNYCVGGNSSFSGSGGTASGTFNNCIGGTGSFGGSSSIVSGTFNYCVGGNNSFGSYGGTASGTFNYCVGGNYSFGSAASGSIGIASGTFNNCKGGNRAYSGTASGTFNNCIGGDESFGSISTASGTFINCTGGNGSFGGSGGTISETARLYYTRLTSGTFPTPAAGGRLILCIDGSNNVKTV